MSTKPHIIFINRQTFEYIEEQKVQVIGFLLNNGQLIENVIFICYEDYIEGVGPNRQPVRTLNSISASQRSAITLSANDHYKVIRMGSQNIFQRVCLEVKAAPSPVSNISSQILMPKVAPSVNTSFSAYLKKLPTYKLRDNVSEFLTFRK